MKGENTRLCDRCLRTVEEGRGEFFEVRIEAVADPTPPTLDTPFDPEQVRAEYEELVNALRDTSPQEAQDQIFRRLIVSLCNRCFATWIEDPTQSENQ